MSERLNSHAEGEQVTDLELEGFLSALVRLHPNPEEKIGNGIQHFIVMRNNDLPDIKSSHLGFRIVQVDSAIPVPFAYSKIIRPLSAQAQFAAALTVEALEETRRIRREAFDRGSVYCADTGDLIPDIHDAQAVHRNPGRGQLHQMFLASEGLTLEQVKVHKPDNKSEWRMCNQELATRWVEFQKANLGGMQIVKVRRSRVQEEEMQSTIKGD